MRFEPEYVYAVENINFEAEELIKYIEEAAEWLEELDLEIQKECPNKDKIEGCIEEIRHYLQKRPT